MEKSDVYYYLAFRRQLGKAVKKHPSLVAMWIF